MGPQAQSLEPWELEKERLEEVDESYMNLSLEEKLKVYLDLNILNLNIKKNA